MRLQEKNWRLKNYRGTLRYLVAAKTSPWYWKCTINQEPLKSMAAVKLLVGCVAAFSVFIIMRSF